METAEQLKETVRQKYAAIAESAGEGACCGPTSCCGPEVEANVPILMSQDYQELNGYVSDADLGLGCGLPTQFAQIKPGDTVVDLGSGAGNDCFVARAEAGEKGRVIGVDMTPAMIDRARKNARLRGFSNVEFVYGDIEEMPLADDLADVVVSNCVMNLVPDKQKAFAETFRILKSGGHFSISDIVLQGDLPEGLRQDAEMYVGCVSGAIQKDAYLQIVQECGFQDIQVQKEREITLPDSILQHYLSELEIADYRKRQPGTPDRGIYSITVFAKKPDNGLKGEGTKCCGPDCCN
jgi:SAM-dependent methyltransferase